MLEKVPGRHLKPHRVTGGKKGLHVAPDGTGRRTCRMA